MSSTIYRMRTTIMPTAPAAHCGSRHALWSILLSHRSALVIESTLSTLATRRGDCNEKTRTNERRRDDGDTKAKNRLVSAKGRNLSTTADGRESTLDSHHTSR